MKKLMIAAAVAAALGGVVGAQAETIRWARSSDVSTLDPHASNINTNINFNHQVYEPLVLRGPTGKLEPVLATEWKLTEDPTVWEFKLRKGVKFHGGQAFTADDVIFSVARAKAKTSDMKSLVASVEEVIKVDDHTVRMRTKGANPILPNSLTNIFILNQAWAKENGAELPQDLNAKEQTYSARNMNGTGPYALASREPDTRTVLRAFDGYWGKGQFPLQITEIVSLPIANAATRIAALLSGEVDFVQDVPVQDVARLKQNNNIRVTEGPENRSIFFGMNVGDKELKYSSVKGKNPLADVRVRQAINQAIDREAIQKAVMRGLSQPSGTIVPPFVDGYDKSFDQVSKPDVAAGKKLLADAGYPDGFDITLHCPNNRYVNDEAICSAAVGMLGRIGIKTTLSARPIAVHLAAVNTQDTDFFMYGWGVPTFDSAYIFDFLVHSRDGSRGQANGTRYKNPELDAKIAAISSEADTAKRSALIAEVWKKVQEDTIYVPIHNQVLNYAMNPKFDIAIEPMAMTYFKYFPVKK